MYAMCEIGVEVDVVDAATEMVVEQIPLSAYTPAITSPRGVAVSPAGDIFIESDGMISVLFRPR